MEQFKEEPFFKETFRYKDLLWMELWKVLWFCQSRRRSNAFRLEIQRTYRQIKFVCFFAVCPFYIHRNWRFLVKQLKKGGRKK